MIGGAQGSGVDTSANIFAKAAAQGGLQVYGNREYYSNIKGEHSYFRVRLSKDLIRSHVDTVDMLATFDDETAVRHAWEVRKDGAIIYDPSVGNNSIENIPTIEKNVEDAPLLQARREQPPPHRGRGPRGGQEERRAHLRNPVPRASEEGWRAGGRDISQRAHQDDQRHGGLGVLRAPRLSAGGGERGYQEAVQVQAEGGRDERGHDRGHLQLS